MHRHNSRNPPERSAVAGCSAIRPSSEVRRPRGRPRHSPVPAALFSDSPQRRGNRATKRKIRARRPAPPVPAPPDDCFRGESPWKSVPVPAGFSPTRPGTPYSSAVDFPPTASAVSGRRHQAGQAEAGNAPPKTHQVCGKVPPPPEFPPVPASTSLPPVPAAGQIRHRRRQTHRPVRPPWPGAPAVPGVPQATGSRAGSGRKRRARR